MSRAHITTHLRDNVNISDPFILVDLQCLLNIVSRPPRSSIFGALLSTQCPSQPPIPFHIVKPWYGWIREAHKAFWSLSWTFRNFLADMPPPFFRLPTLSCPLLSHTPRCISTIWKVPQTVHPSPQCILIRSSYGSCLETILSPIYPRFCPLDCLILGWLLASEMTQPSSHISRR